MLKVDNLPPSCAFVMKSGNLNFLEPSGHLGPVMGLIYLFFFFFNDLQEEDKNTFCEFRM